MIGSTYGTMMFFGVSVDVQKYGLVAGMCRIVIGDIIILKRGDVCILIQELQQEYCPYTRKALIAHYLQSVVKLLFVMMNGAAQSVSVKLLGITRLVKVIGIELDGNMLQSIGRGEMMKHKHEWQSVGSSSWWNKFSWCECGCLRVINTYYGRTYRYYYPKVQQPPSRFEKKRQ